MSSSWNKNGPRSNGLLPCLRLHAGGSDHLPRETVTIPRDELGGISSCPRLHAGGSDHLPRETVTIPRVELGGISSCLRLHAGGSDYLPRETVTIPQIQVKCDMLLEGSRPRKIVRFYPAGWPVVALPREEQYFGWE